MGAGRPHFPVSAAVIFPALLASVSLFILAAEHDQDEGAVGAKLIRSPISGQTYEPYPQTYDRRPEMPSPYVTEEGFEYIVVFTSDQEYAVVPVTVENRGINPDQRHPFCKGNQLAVDGADFPTLAETGLHNERELEATRSITGRPIEQITEIGRPGRISAAGFLAEDEEIIPVLVGDNRLVGRLGLTHPEMARPLYHVRNMLLMEYDLGRASQYWEPFEYFLCNGKQVHLAAQGSKGFQESIFDDEILGNSQIYLYRELDENELELLRENYSRLDAEELNLLVEALTRIHTGEMVPYYIMRYGFYEGHTSYRADPIAIAFIFGLRSLEEIEAAVEGRIYEALTGHYR